MPSSVPGRASTFSVPARQTTVSSTTVIASATSPAMSRQANRPARLLPATICADPGSTSVISTSVIARLKRVFSLRLRRSARSCGMTSFHFCPGCTTVRAVPGYGDV